MVDLIEQKFNTNLICNILYGDSPNTDNGKFSANSMRCIAQCSEQMNIDEHEPHMLFGWKYLQSISTLSYSFRYQFFLLLEFFMQKKLKLIDCAIVFFDCTGSGIQYAARHNLNVRYKWASRLNWKPNFPNTHK